MRRNSQVRFGGRRRGDHRPKGRHRRLAADPARYRRPGHPLRGSFGSKSSSAVGDLPATRSRSGTQGRVLLPRVPAEAAGASRSAPVAGPRAPCVPSACADRPPAPWPRSSRSPRAPPPRRARPANGRRRSGPCPRAAPGAGAGPRCRPRGRGQFLAVGGRPHRKPRSAPAWCPRSWRSSSAGVSRPRPSRLAPPAAELAFGRPSARQLDAGENTNAMPATRARRSLLGEGDSEWRPDSA